MVIELVLIEAELQLLNGRSPRTFKPNTHYKIQN